MNPKELIKKPQNLIIAALMILVLTLSVALLRPKTQSSGTNHVGAPVVAAKKADVYRCPMHPAIVSDKPGICPICHMDLQKVDDDDEGAAPVAHSAHGADNAMVAGRSSFSLSQEKQQLIGVATTHATVQHLNYEVRATGRVAFDPDLYTAVEEYRQALLTRTQMADSPYGNLKNQTNELISSAETRLKLMGLSESQIRSLSKTQSDAMSLLLPKGQAWIYAEVYEYEVGGIIAGQSIEVLAAAVPGKTFSGKISSISPIVNNPTRTVRVRALVPDPQHLLRPDAFVNVKIKVEFGKRLAVPEDAVLHSGNENFVFVVRGKGKFEPRAVVTGVKANNFYEIVSGISEGEAVVSAANFLIDSESRMRSALQNMSSTPDDNGKKSRKAAPAATDVPQGHQGHQGK